MPKQVRPHVGTSGFTLLEMVVTLTILGFILLIILGAFRLGLSAWEKGESSRRRIPESEGCLTIALPATEVNGSV